jgi:hypothetical protein
MKKLNKDRFGFRIVTIVVMALTITSCSAALDAQASNKVLETCLTGLEQAAAASSAEVNALPLSTLETIVQNCLQDETLWGNSVLECTRRSNDNDVHCTSRYGSSSIKLESNISEQLRTKYGASN